MHEVGVVAPEFLHNRQQKLLLEESGPQQREVHLCHNFDDVRTALKLLQQPQRNRYDLVVKSIDSKLLLEDVDEQFHDAHLLLQEERVVGDSHHWAHQFQHLGLHQAAGAVLYQKLNHVQTFLHDFLLAVGHAFDQDADVVLERALLVPNHLVLAGELVFKGDHHLPDVLRGPETSAIGYDEQVDLMSQSTERLVPQEHQG